MSDGTASAAGMAARIEAALDGLAARDGLRVLLAVESGSRAWGFPSQDSDWDVRLIYARPRAAYLSVVPVPETLEEPIEEGLDVSGWDIRKALALITGSNAAALEWLNSPIVYRCDAGAVASLRGVAARAAHLPQLAYHYDRLARRSWSAGDEPIRMKSLFYAVRPALALCWLRQRRTAPPMDLPALIAGLDLPPGLLDALADLRERKAAAVEADMTPRLPDVEAFLAACLETKAPRPLPWDRAAAIADADRFLADFFGV